MDKELGDIWWVNIDGSTKIQCLSKYKPLSNSCIYDIGVMGTQWQPKALLKLNIIKLHLFWASHMYVSQEVIKPIVNHTPSCVVIYSWISVL